MNIVIGTTIGTLVFALLGMILAFKNYRSQKRPPMHTCRCSSATPEGSSPKSLCGSGRIENNKGCGQA